MPEVGDELEGAIAEVGALMEELEQSGEWIGGEALADPSQARTVRVRGGSPAITDGPFAEAKEHFAGYCMLDCETEERALQIAARWPDARKVGVELRRCSRRCSSGRATGHPMIRRRG